MEVTKSFDNRLFSAKRNNILNEYRKIGKFTDLTLRSTDGKTMTVHKNILSASCPYFEGMFNSDLVDTHEQLIQLVDDIKYADLEIIVEYIYTGKTKISLENAENIFIKAQYIQLVELQKFCSNFIIENIKVENCLKYWRKSIKYLNYDLTKECLKFIKLNCKSFMESNITKLTVEEFKLLMSTDEILTLNQEDLYKFVSIWIKVDLESRNLYLMELIKNLDFIKMSDEFIETEIMSDKILQNNGEFVTKMVRITFQKMRDVKKDNSDKSNETVPKTNEKSKQKQQKSEKSKEKQQVSEKSKEKLHSREKSQERQLNKKPGVTPKNTFCYKLKNVYLITNCGIYKSNSYESQWAKIYNFKYVKPWFFATTTFKDNIFTSGGWIKETEIASSNFESWNTSSRKFNMLPQMIEKRYKHQLVNFKERIYCCAGDKNNGSTEFFDFQNLSWNRAPSMNENKYSFGLISTDESLYAFGGWKTSLLRSNMVEQFDSREGTWRIISRVSPPLSQAVTLSNNSVYCFDGIYGRKIFDLRMNSWTNSLDTVFDDNYGAQYFVGNCDIVQCNNEILGVFQTDYSKTWATFKYDYNGRKWSNVNIPLNLTEYYDINLCVTSPL